MINRFRDLRKNLSVRDGLAHAEMKARKSALKVEWESGWHCGCNWMEVRFYDSVWILNFFSSLFLRYSNSTEDCQKFISMVSLYLLCLFTSIQELIVKNICAFFLSRQALKTRMCLEMLDHPFVKIFNVCHRVEETLKTKIVSEHVEGSF